MSFYYEEKPILTEDKDYMKVKHIVLKGSNYEIGRKIAEIAQCRHGIKKAPSNSYIRNKKQREYIKKLYPIHYERMRGISYEFGLNLEDDGYDFSVLRDIRHKPGCSAVYYPPTYTADGKGILCKNTDFMINVSFEDIIGEKSRSDNALILSNIYILELHPDNGYSSLTVTEFDAFGETLEGVNSQGLSVVHLADEQDLEIDISDDSIGLNEFKTIQLLLDTCSNVQQAKEALLKNRHFCIFTPVHLLIADKSGKSFVWEYSHRDKKGFIIDGNNKPQIVTNFSLRDYATICSFRQEEGSEFGFDRYIKLYNEVNSYKNSFTLDNIKRINAEAYVNYGCPEEELCYRTLWSVVFNNKDKSMEISFYLGDEENESENFKIKNKRSQYLKFVIN